MRACCLARTGGGGCRPYFFLIKVFYCKWHGQTKQGSREASSSILGGDQGQRGRCCKGWGARGARGGGPWCRGLQGAGGHAGWHSGQGTGDAFFLLFSRAGSFIPGLSRVPTGTVGCRRAPPLLPSLPQVEKPPGAVPRGTQILGPAPQGAQGQDTQPRAWARGHFSFPVGFFSLRSPGRGHPRRCPHHEHTDGFSWCARCP